MSNNRLAPGIKGLPLHLLAFDPGLLGLRLASRATAAVALAAMAVHVISLWSGQPGTQALLAGAMAMFSTTSVKDPDPRSQMITMAWAPLPAALSLTVAVLLAPWPGILHVAFVGVIFLAVWARHFGPRGFAFGMLGFVAYFLVWFLNPPAASLPWFYLSVVVGLGSAAVMRFVVLPERPEQALPRMLRSFFALADSVLASAEDSAAKGEPGARGQRRLRRRLMQLNATALEVEALTEGMSDRDRRAFDITPFTLFELELAIEQVAIEAPDMPAEKRHPARRSLRILRRCLRGRSTPPANVLDGIADAASSPSDGGLWGLKTVVTQAFGADSRRVELPRIVNRSGSARAATGVHEGSERMPRRFSPAWLHAAWRKLLADPIARQAIQASVAGAIAIVAGQLVSPERGYWAAITAFIVFTGTESRGEVLLKGGQRMLGTLGGVAVGVALGTLVHDKPPLQMSIILACVFVGAFFLRRSHSVTMFSITILVAMLYSLLGFFSAELLGLRMAETVIGAVVGMGVAAVLLPTSTRRRVRDASVEVLLALADLIQACGERAATGHRRDDLTRQSRRVDSNAQALRNAIQPLLRTTTGLLSRKGARRWLRAMWVCRHYARTLVRLSRDPAWFASPEWTRATAEVANKFRLLAGETPDDHAEAITPVEMPDLQAGDEAGRDANAEGITALQRLDRIAIRLLDTHTPLV